MGRGGRRKYPLPVPIHPSLCPCLRVSPVQPGTTTPSAPPAPRAPLSPAPPPSRASQAQSPPAGIVAATTTAASFQLPSQPPVSPHYPRRSAPAVLSRPAAAHTPAPVHRYTAGRGLVGRVVLSTRHEALEKQRCPRMYFLIIDFNDEGSRCQRHLGCWAE